MKKFKSLKILILILAFSFIAVGCSTNSSETSSIEGSLTDLMESIYSGIKRDTSGLMQTEINNENLSYYLGLDTLDFKEGLASEPMINVDPHSVVLIRVNDTSSIEEIKSQIKSKVNPMKWVCVGVEDKNVIVDSIGDIIILIMDNNEAKELHENFKNFNK